MTPGVPTHSKISGRFTVPPIAAAIIASARIIGTLKSAQAVWGYAWAGSTIRSAPIRSAAARRSAEKSVATTGPRPRAFSEAITARPTGPQPITMNT